MREFKELKIAVAGTGYVGLSIATLLSQHHNVTAVDIIQEKVELINHKKSPIQDEYIEKYLAEKELDLTATLDAKEAYSDADFVVIAAPTNVYSTYRSNVAFSDAKNSLSFLSLRKVSQICCFLFSFTYITVYSTLRSNVAFLAFLMSLIHLARRFYVAPVFRANIFYFLNFKLFLCICLAVIFHYFFYCIFVT